MSQRTADRNSVLKNLRWGLGWGLFSTVFFSAFVIVRAFLAGSEEGESIVMIVSTYLISGIVGGIAVGLLRPVIHRRLASISVGILAVIPVMLTVRYTKAGGEPWSFGEAIFLGLVSVFMGTMGGLIVHGQLKE